MVWLPLLLATVTVLSRESTLRARCDPAAETVAVLPAHAPVRILFAVASADGACYKVESESRQTGYLPASALEGSQDFDQARRAAPAFDRASPHPVAAGGEPRANLPSPPVPGDELTGAATHLAAGRPQEALSRLTSYLGRHPQDAQALAMAGFAAYRLHRLSEAAGFWQESLALAPDRAVELHLERARRELAAEGASQQLVGIRFDFRYDSAAVAAEDARRLIPVLDSEYTRVSEHLGCPAEERIVAVVQTRESYLKATGAAEWSGGQYDGRIRVALLEPAPGETTRRALTHELVHACLARIGPLPTWLHEGLAQKLSGEALGPRERALLNDLVRRGQLPALGRLSQNWSRLSARHAEAAYAAALAAVEVIYRDYGMAGVRSVLRDPGTLAQITAETNRRLQAGEF